MKSYNISSKTVLFKSALLSSVSSSAVKTPTNDIYNLQTKKIGGLSEKMFLLYVYEFIKLWWS